MFSISRFLQKLHVLRDFWRQGGSIYVSTAQIDYGQLLKGKSVLITGGSSGIGLAIARKALSCGATVIITGRDKNKLDRAQSELNSNRVKTLVWDVSKISQIPEKFAEAVALADGRIDILVNNAGVRTQKIFLETTEQIWDDTINTNAKAVVFLCQYICNNWIADQHKGKIINISSFAGVRGVLDGPYGMSKWGIIGFTRGIGKHLAPQGIIVNAIAPGVIIGTGLEGIQSQFDTSDNLFCKDIPVQRYGIPEEVAEIALFLMSDAANYIVGQTIVCDGGGSII